MIRLDSMQKRMGILENKLGLVELPDGTRFKPRHALHLMYKGTKLGHDLGREHQLSDFSTEDQELLKFFVLWSPDPSQWGQISALVSEMARKMVGYEVA